MDAFITQVGNALTGLATSFGTAVSSIVNTFVVTSDTGAITGLTPLGSMVAISLGIALLGTVISFAVRFLPRRGR